MRAAYLLSLMCIICGVAAALGYPAVYVAGRAVMGLSGLLIALVYATFPPLVVLGIRRMRRK
jgi:hypothetical protein